MAVCGPWRSRTPHLTVTRAGLCADYSVPTAVLPETNQLLESLGFTNLLQAWDGLPGYTVYILASNARPTAAKDYSKVDVSAFLHNGTKELVNSPGCSPE
eukprot:SM000021S06538  [mRNA]  locus=s21:1049592:1051021:- [translate_table: standard]